MGSAQTTYAKNTSGSGPAVLDSKSKSSLKAPDFAYQIGDVRPKDGSAGLASTPWEVNTGPNSWANTSPPYTTTPTGRIIINHLVIGDAAPSHTYHNDIIIIAGGKLRVEDIATPSADFIPAGKTIEVQNGGELEIKGQIQLNSGANFIVENGGKLTLNNSKFSNTHPIWNGIEKFEKGSLVYITNWNWDSPLLALTPQISINSSGYLFGTLSLYRAANAQKSWTLMDGNPSSDVKLCADDLIVSNGPSFYVTGTNSNGAGFTIGGNFNLKHGSFNFGTTTSGSVAFNNNYTILGMLIIEQGTVKLHHVEAGVTVPTGSVTVYGNVSTSANSLIDNNGNKKLVLVTGSETSPRVIDVAGIVANTRVEVGSGYRRLNRDLTLGTGANVTVLNGTVLDFGFDNKNTALNIVRNLGATGESFELQNGGTLKITSPDGISEAGNDNNIGNVQVGDTPAKRVFADAGIYHYIGKTDQNAGTGLPRGTAAAGTSMKVIADLQTTNPPLNDNLKLTISGLQYLSSQGELLIRRGRIVDAGNNGFADANGQSGKLTMEGGRYEISRAGVQPALSNTSLTGGVIEFSGTEAVQASTLPLYLNVEVTGTNVAAGTDDTDGLTFQSGGNFTVKNGGIFKVTNPDGFLGSNTTAVRNTNTPTVTLETGSAVEYSRAGDQVISNKTSSAGHPKYAGLNVSGSGVKSAVGTTEVQEMTKLLSTDATLKVPATPDYNPAISGPQQPNVFYADGGIDNATGTTGKFLLANNAVLLQNTAAVNTAAKGSGTARYYFVDSFCQCSKQTAV